MPLPSYVVQAALERLGESEGDDGHDEQIRGVRIKSDEEMQRDVDRYLL